MADVTTIMPNMKFLRARYVPQTKTHMMHFMADGRDLFINVDREDFGDLVTKCVESWAEGSADLVEDIRKELNQ